MYEESDTGCREDAFPGLYSRFLPCRRRHRQRLNQYDTVIAGDKERETRVATRSGKKAAAQRDWAAEQERFLSEIAPESHFHRAFDGLGDVFFFAKNLAGETLFFSRGILPHVGLHDYEQMLGATDEDLTPGPFAAHYRADDRAVIESRKPLIGHVDLWFDEIGLPDWYETNKYPLLDRSGRVIGVMGTLRGCRGVAPPGAVGSRLVPALTTLRAELTRFPPVARLAKDCRMSTRQLQRSFHEVFAFSPRTYWMKCRIRAASEALRAGNEPIIAISQRLGFCDQSNFTQHFRRHTGLTPSAALKQANARRSSV